MAERSTRSLVACLRRARNDKVTTATRAFSTTPAARLEVQDPQTTASPGAPPPPATPSDQAYRIRDPNTVSSAHAERQLLKNQRLTPIGSRRRRAAIASTSSIPFSELPYQCFQEARSFLKEDRQEKLEQIRVRRQRIAALQAKDVAPQDEARKDKTLSDMRRKLEELKIKADINDPVVKKKFEDGQGDMNKPIYRHLSDLQWRSYRREILLQRITQMNVVPDVLPAVDPIVSTVLTFSRKHVQHGDFVDSALSETAPVMTIQSYEKGKKLYTIAVVNADVPDVETDAYTYRCHYLACNIELSPTDTRVHLGKVSEETQLVLPWLPAYSQKGLAYQRMSIFILEQPKSDETLAPQPLDVTAMKASTRYTERHGFKLRSLVDRYGLKPVGVDLFRTKFDEGTMGVMQRAGIPGHDVEFKRKRIEPLPYKRIGTGRYR